MPLPDVLPLLEDGSVRLRAFRYDDVPLVLGAACSFAVCANGRASVGYQREGLLRSWQEVGGVRRDMLMYSLLPGDVPGPPRPDRAP